MARIDSRSGLSRRDRRGTRHTLGCVEASFSGHIVYWRGPSPWHFVRVPDDVGEAIRDLAPQVSYGWGVVPVSVRTGSASWTTSLFPKNGSYLVPVKFAVLRAEGLDVGDTVTLHLRVVEGSG